MFQMRTTKTAATTQAILLCACFVSGIYQVGGELPRPRGVSLSNAALYQPRTDKNWVCLDGSKVIPYVQINDEYCDCADGSDEPGTSACPNGQFHCTNYGHQPQDITSSQVNDGICDCCDGSDEYDTVACKNICIELGALEKEKRKNEEELYKLGAQKRKEMIVRGKQIRAERDARRAELQMQLKEQTALRSEKEILKHEAEALEATSLEAFKAKQNELNAQQAAEANAEPYQLQQEATASFVSYDTNKDGYVEVSELMIDMTLDRDRNGAVTVEEAKYFLDERERVDLDAFITLSWPRIKPIKMLAEGIFKPPVLTESNPEANDLDEIAKENEQNSEALEKPTQEHEERGDIDPEEELEEEEHEDEHFDDEEADVGVGEAHAETNPTPEYDPETQHVIQQANEARNAYDEVDRHIREIEQEVKGIDEQNAKDYGPNEEYAFMDGECFKYEDREYVYTLCPFDRASQKQRSGGAETTLGRWENWIGDATNKYNKQKYSNGAACWNGPQRTAIVSISCGLESKVVAVSEPNRCEYYYEFETPAACDTESFAATENQHDEL